MKRPKNKKLPRGVFIRDGAYWIRYADQNGIIHREKVGPFLDPAKSAVEKRRSEVREGKFFPEKINQRSVLFGEIAKDYKEQSKRMKRDWKHDDARIELLLKTLKDVPTHELTPGRIEGVLEELTEKNDWAPATYNRYRAILSGVFRCAIKRAKAQFNPVRETTHRKENNARVRYLSNKEEKRLMDYTRVNSPAREAEILVALHSGMRRSEQYHTAQVPDGGLKWEHINLRASIIRLPRSKAERPREIPINSVLRKALLSVPRIASPYVFDATDPNKWFVEACRSAKVKNFHWHDLRHTFASRLAMAGVPIRAIADLMGHSQVQTTARYAHLAPGYLAEAVEKLAAPIPTPQEDQTDTAIDTELLELYAGER